MKKPKVSISVKVFPELLSTVFSVFFFLSLVRETEWVRKSLWVAKQFKDNEWWCVLRPSLIQLPHSSVQRDWFSGGRHPQPAWVTQRREGSCKKKKKEAALGSCVKSYLSIRQGDSVALFMNGDWCRPCLCNAKCSWNDFFRILYQREKYDGIKHSLIISLKEPEATTKSELKVTPPLNVMKYLRGPNNSYEAFSTEKENKKRHFRAENMDKNPDTVRSDIYLCRLQC